MGTAAVKIKFADVRRITRDSKRLGITWQPFRLEAYDERGELIFFAGVSHDESMPLQLTSLNRIYGEQVVSAAIVRWAVRRVEETVRFHRLPQGGDVFEIDLQPTDLEQITGLASDKTCRYQALIEDELFCFAADKGDEYAEGQQRVRFYAPTSRSVCQSCNLPSTDVLCSHFVHPRVQGVASKDTAYARTLVSQQCDLGRTEIQNPSRCRPDGNACWERLVSPQLRKPSLPVRPRELPMAFDFLETTWRLVFGRRLVRLRSAESVSGLVSPCFGREDFAQRLSELTDLMKLFDISDDLLPDDKKMNKAETLNRLRAALATKFGQDQSGSLDDAIKTLQAINKARWALQHSAASQDLPIALAELGIPYPIEDYSEAWESVRAHAVDSLSSIRKIVQLGAE